MLEHSGSTQLRYALAERAATLGWARSRLVVIDDDLGVSAATADVRAGFARLVAEIAMGHLGLMLGLEMSRLARADRAGLASAFGAVLAVGDAAGRSGRRL